MRVLGIDPSSQATGYGVIEEKEGQYQVLAFGVIRPAARLPLPEKLNKIRLSVDQIMEKYSPEEVAIENPFYAKNIRTAITLGQVRGAILVAVASHECDLFEYSPREIKKAVTGYGQAEKSQVLAMVKALLQLPPDDLAVDASDALAAAYCHLLYRHGQNLLAEKRSQ